MDFLRRRFVEVSRDPQSAIRHLKSVTSGFKATHNCSPFNLRMVLISLVSLASSVLLINL